jgi:hypothetical protein
MDDHNEDINESTLVSESEISQSTRIPSRRERDAAYSTGAGRKAIEIPQSLQEVESEASEYQSAPVGLDLETRAAFLPRTHHH